MGGVTLSVCLITYNQAGYIREALDSILMQQVNFTWEIIIADDHSTDGSVEIIREYKNKYPGLIRLLLQDKNVGAAKNWTDLMMASGGDYVAYLEGDDYWTAKDKLSTEVDFLIKNKEYALVCTDYDVLKSAEEEITGNYLGSVHGLKSERDIILTEYLFNRVAIRSLTAVMRRAALMDYFRNTDQSITDNPSAGDLPLWLYLLSRHKVRYLPVSTAMYRVLPGTGSRPSDPDRKRSFQKGVCDILDYFIRENGLSRKYYRRLDVLRVLSEMEYTALNSKPGKTLRMFFSLILKGEFSRRALVLVLKSIKNGRLGNVKAKVLR
jgi:glycosyltransferase involved in cell wall biosynthesis